RQLKDGMILTLKARDMPYIVAGKVFVASDSAEIERFEVYIKSQSKESKILKILIIHLLMFKSNKKESETALTFDGYN
ncbi:hypothetical protein, partial [Enterococcus sp. DIV1420a]